MKKEPTNVIIWNDGQISQVYGLVIVLGGRWSQEGLHTVILATPTTQKCLEAYPGLISWSPAFEVKV